MEAASRVSDSRRLSTTRIVSSSPWPRPLVCPLSAVPPAVLPPAPLQSPTLSWHAPPAIAAPATPPASVPETESAHTFHPLEARSHLPHPPDVGRGEQGGWSVAAWKNVPQSSRCSPLSSVGFRRLSCEALPYSPTLKPTQPVRAKIMSRQLHGVSTDTMSSVREIDQLSARSGSSPLPRASFKLRPGMRQEVSEAKSHRLWFSTSFRFSDFDAARVFQKSSRQCSSRPSQSQTSCAKPDSSENLNQWLTQFICSLSARLRWPSIATTIPRLVECLE